MASRVREAARKRMVLRYAFNAGLEVAICTGARALDFAIVSGHLGPIYQFTYNSSLYQTLLYLVL